MRERRRTAAPDRSRDAPRCARRRPRPTALSAHPVVPAEPPSRGGSPSPCRAGAHLEPSVACFAPAASLVVATLPTAASNPYMACPRRTPQPSSRSFAIPRPAPTTLLPFLLSRATDCRTSINHERTGSVHRIRRCPPCGSQCSAHGQLKEAQSHGAREQTAIRSSETCRANRATEKRSDAQTSSSLHRRGGCADPTAPSGIGAHPR